MDISAKTLRLQLFKMKPLLSVCSLRALRKGQNVLGELMESRFRREVIIKEHSFDDFCGAWVMPRDERRQGVMLYLHGGGYTRGDMEYATGVGTILAAHLCTR